MIQASVLEQIKTFFNILIKNQNFINLTVISIVSLFLLLIANKFKNKKITKILYLGVYVGIFGTLIVLYHSEILKLFDYLINNIFLFLFFPNLAVYTLVLVIINVIVVKSTFSQKDNKLIMVLNSLFFVVFNIIFYLIIDNVIKNNINVYEQLSIYTNNNLLVLVELSMKLFIVWLLILAIVKLSTNLFNTINLHRQFNTNLILNDVANAMEFDNVKKFSTVIEKPIAAIDETSLTFNKDEFVPIKKIHRFSKKVNNSEVMFENKVEGEKVIELEENPIILEENSITTESSKETKNINNDLISKMSIYESINLNNDSNSLDFEANEETKLIQENDISNETTESIKENNIINEEDFKFEEIRPYTSLSSYDSIFTSDTKEIETNVDNNMSIVFNKENNYLDNILNDIESLKNNKDDKEQIEKIYENVKMNQNDLSLKDYNNLITALIDIKNA